MVLLFLQSYECHVCDQIQNRLKAERDKKEMPEKNANQSHFGCQQPYPLLVDPKDMTSDDPWHNIDWIDMFWKGFDDSLAVNDMLRAKETDSSKFGQYLKNIHQKRRKS